MSEVVRFPEFAVESPRAGQLDRDPRLFRFLIAANPRVRNGAGSCPFQDVARGAGFDERLAKNELNSFFEELQISLLEGIRCELPGIALREMVSHFFSGQPSVGDALRGRNGLRIVMRPLPLLKIDV